MIISLDTNKIYADGHRIGGFRWHFFPHTMIKFKINNAKIRMFYVKGEGIRVLLGSQKRAVIREGALEYGATKYVVRTGDTNSGQEPAVVGQDGSQTLAVRHILRELEYNGEIEPVILAFSIMCMFISSGNSITVLPLSDDRISRMFENTMKNPLKSTGPLWFLATIVIVLSAYLAQKYSSGVAAEIFIGSYGAFIVGYVLFLIFRGKKIFHDN